MDFSADAVWSAIKARKTGVLALIAMALIVTVWYVDFPLTKHYPTVPSELAWRVVVSLTIISIFSALLAWFHYPRYVWNERMQLSYGKRDKHPYCPACMGEGRNTILRMGSQEKFLYCPNKACGGKFANRLRPQRTVFVRADNGISPEEDEIAE